MSKETECKLETLINTGKGKYTDIEKEKIDHPHPLELINKDIDNFTCSNITLHSQKKIILIIKLCLYRIWEK